MPSRKKSKRKARKAKSPPQPQKESGHHEHEHEQQRKDEAHDDAADGLDSKLDYLLSIDDMMANMRGEIVASLGEGYDDASLKSLDRKLCRYFLPDDSFYFDDKENETTASPEEPTRGELERYKKSDVIRKGFLRKAANAQATCHFLDGRGHKNMRAYQGLYDDLTSYHYAWFEMIFKESRTELFSACSVLIKFASVKLEKRGDDDVDDLRKIMGMIREMKHRYFSTGKSREEETQEDRDNSGTLQYDFYELSYKMSLEMAKANRKEEADDCFSEALSLEAIWAQYCGQGDRRCVEVLEFATGQNLSGADLMDIDDQVCEYDGFYYYECLRAHLRRSRGSVAWKFSAKPFELYGEASGSEDEEDEEERCDNCGMPSGLLRMETGKKLLRCARCKAALYCDRECQIAHWRGGHKKVCGRA